MKKRGLAAWLLLAGAQARCGPEQVPCVGVGAPLDRTPPPDGAAVPDWAVGTFGRHEIDVYNYHLTADGEVRCLLSGGDVGGCGFGTAVFVDGRVRVDCGGESFDLVHTTEGRTLRARVGTRDLTCGWAVLRPTALCGRDVGGCGGYGAAVPCPWSELEAACRSDSGDTG